MMSTPPNGASEPLLDLQGLAAGVRWRRRAWLSAALIGMLVGGLSGILISPGSTAVARIFVVHEGEQAGNTAELVNTDIALFETTRIAGAALEALGAQERPDDFLDRYSVEAVAGNVIELTVNARSDGDAVARAQALADAFIADHVRRTESQAEAEAGALLDRRTAAERELSDINDRITATVVQGPSASSELEALYSAQGALASQIRDLGQRAEDASIGAPRVAAGTQIVDPPRPVTGSRLITGAVNAAVGLVLGLGAGLAFAAVAAVVRDRPVLRRDIAANVGASIIVQLPARRRGPLSLFGSRSAVERRRAAAALARTVRDGPGAAVSLLELGCPRTAAALAVDVAEELATEHPVIVIDDLPGRQVHRVPASSGSVTVVDGAGYAAGRDGLDHRGEHHLGVGSVGPGTAWMDLARLGSETLLVVRAGSASAAWLHDVARQLADADIQIIGVVLVHPDPRDRSDGTLWDGLHHALRGRVPVASTGPGEMLPNGGQLNGNGTWTRANGTTTGNGSSGNGSSGNGRATTVDGLPTESFHPDVAATTPDEAVEVT